jgi:methylated-DNA-[protein]-cysteine S-methyltransferase
MQIWYVKSKFLGLLRITFDESVVGVTASRKAKLGAIVQVEMMQKGKPSQKSSKELDIFKKALKRYEEGNLSAFDDCSLHSSGTDFQKEVLTRMREIAPGTVVSYGELARLSGKPKAHRAVATVCATNKIPLLIPCHRVVPADFSIGQYASRLIENGSELKIGLLEHENAIED